jgi:hypothetical protein
MSTFVPVSDQLFSVSACLVPETALSPGADAAKRSQETLFTLFLILKKNSFI